MKPRGHIIASTAVSGMLYWFTGNRELAFSSFVAGIFFDVDHFFDYYMRFRFRKFCISHFLESFKGKNYGKIFVLFHGWEILALLLAASWLSGWNPYLLGVFIGTTHHMAFDQIFNKGSFHSYFLLYRIFNSFDFRKSFPKKFIGENLTAP